MSSLVLVLVICFVVMLVISVPISIALVLAAAIAIVGYSHFSLDLIPLNLFSATNSFLLLAIPFFVLAGSLMTRGGMSDRLIGLARAVVGRVHGGVAMVSIVSCMLFAAVSGSTAATTAAIGIVLIPAMMQSGFSRGAATGLQATAGSIGIIIPPSIPFVLMGVIGGISIGDLFLAGILPGIGIGLSLMLVAYVIARVQKHTPSQGEAGLVEIGKSFAKAILPLLTVFWVIGGIICGIVTPTEAAIVAVVWALLVGGLVYRELSWSDLKSSLVDTTKVTGIVVLCIGATAPFAWLLTVEEVPKQIAEAMLSVSSSPIVLKLMMLTMLLCIGTFLDLTPAMILLVPILKDIAYETVGMEPVQFGVMLVLALGIGQSTPPVGIGLFVACSVGKARIGEVSKALPPFLIAMVIVLLVVTFWAPMTTALPEAFLRE